MQNDTQGGQRQPAQDNCGVENRNQSQEQRASEEDERKFRRPWWSCATRRSQRSRSGPDVDENPKDTGLETWSGCQLPQTDRLWPMNAGPLIDSGWGKQRAAHVRKWLCACRNKTWLPPLRDKTLFAHNIRRSVLFLSPASTIPQTAQPHLPQ